MADLIATPGDPLANSYTTTTAASDFLTMRLDTRAWTEASVDDQIAALQWATRLLDEQVGWYGMPTYPDQALALPQVGLLDQWGRALATNVIPMAVQQATALYALALLENVPPPETEAMAATGDLIIKSTKIGDTEITYQNVAGGTTAAAQTTVSPHAIPAEVRALLWRYGHVPGMGSVPLVRT